MELHLDSLILQTIALLITAFLLPRLEVHGPLSAFIMVLILSFMNTHLWDTALFFSIPNSLTSQALVTLLVNGVLFWVLAKCLPGVTITGFFPALAAPLVFTVVSILTYKYGRDIDWNAIAGSIDNTFGILKHFVKTGGAK